MDNELIMIHIMEVEELAAEGNDRRRLVLQKEDPFEVLSNFMFHKIFRLTKPLARYLVHILDPFLEPPRRISALDKQTKVLLALHFYATGSYQTDIGLNIFSAVSQASVSRSITEVTDALNEPVTFNRWVKFPHTVEELRRIRSRFYENHGIPGVIGVVDGTHVAIVPPKANDEQYPEHIYVNRKGYHSINVQLVCDSNLKILNVNSRFPGSCNDIYIWTHSAIEDTVRNLARTHPGFYILGDSGYCLRTWLQIPVVNAEPATPEEHYNVSFRSARCSIERCIGLLKMRFRCLLKHRVLHYSPTKASKIINACTVLHNLCIEHNIAPPEAEDDVDVDLGIYDDNAEPIQNPNPRQNVDLAAGHELQRRIIRNYFRA